MKTVSETRRRHASLSRPARGRCRFLTNAGGAALALACVFPSAAWARDYVASSDAELRQAILDANADGEASSTITLTGNIAITGALPESTKTLIIDTDGFSTNGMALTGIATVVGTINGVDDTVNGTGQTGLNLVAVGGVPTTVTNNATVTGGDGSISSNDGLGANVQNNGQLINNGTITGGSSGGPGSLQGGHGIQVSNTASAVNNGLIQGGTGLGVTGGSGAVIGVGLGGVQSFTNNVTGIVRGGEGAGGAPGGIGMELKTLSVPIINRGLIEGGNGAAAILGSTLPVDIRNSGIIRTGAGGTVAIDVSQAQLTLLELQAGSTITGLVIANAGASFAQTLQLGGSVDATFDMSTVGTAAQYRNFNRFVKNGTSIWTLTGDASGMPVGVWELQQGTLLFDDTATGQTAAILGNGALVFQQDGALSVGSLNGGISVLQSGPGTTTLVGNNHSGGTTLTGGKLSIGTETALGSGAFTITGGALQWIGNGSIARTIDWAASGAEIEVTGSQLALSQPLLGGGALTKSGAGTLVLNGDNSYAGGTTINAGTLRVNGSILGDVRDNGTLIFGNSTAYTYAGSVTGSGDVSVFGAGLLTLTGNSNFDGILSVNSFNGGLNITDGATVAWGGATIHSNGQFLVNSGSTAISGGGTAIANSSSTPTTLAVDGTGSTFSTASINAAASLGRTITISVTNGGRLTTTGDINVRAATISAASTNTGQLIVDGVTSRADVAGGLLVANSSITNGKLTISGGGALHTAGASSIGFATGNIRGVPTATITGAGSNWTSTGSLAMSNGSFTLDQGGAASFTNATFGTAPLGATLTVSGPGSRLTTTTGDLVIGSDASTGTLTLADGGAVDVAGALVLGDAGTATGVLNIGGAEGEAAESAGAFTAPSLSFGSATSRLNFNHSDTDYLFAAAISGAGAVNHVAGDTSLTGNSSGFTGTTNVSGGTLRVNGTLGDATSLVNVLSGARLGGAGTVGGDVFVDNGGTIAPGNSPGTLTIAGDLTLSGSSLLDFEFGQSNVVGGPLNDLIEVGGDLTLAGTIDVTVTPGDDFSTGVYRVISYGGSLVDSGFAIGNAPGGSIAQVQTSVAGQVNLVNSAGADVNFWDAGTAGDGVISGGAGLWQAAAGNGNWTLIDGSVNAAYNDDNFAIFMAAPGTVTVDTDLGAVNASGMQFASDGYIVTGDPIGLTGSESILRVGDGTTVGAGFTATIESDLASAGDVSKTDLGTLVLTGDSVVAGYVFARAGELRLDVGGTLNSANGSIGPDGGNQAIVTVTGDDGSGNASTWTIGGDLEVGYDGTGTLNITDGGKVVSNLAYVGRGAGVGQALVSGAGSIWENTGRITIGSFGTGDLRIADGATVSSNGGVVGSSGEGNVVVTGPGTSWTNAEQLNVGSFGTGTLRIEDGASITSNQGYIGANATGSVTVTGPGSNWLVTTYSMTVGNQGDGALTIEDGGRVRAEGGFSLGVAAGSSGTVALQGTAANRAVLETGQIGAGLGTVSFTIDGGLLRATQDVDDFFVDFDMHDLVLGADGGVIDTDGHDIGISPRFVGAGGLIKDGAGTLTLSGASSYAGATAVNAGTLLVNGDQSLATGLTTVAAAATLGGAGTIGGSVDMSAGGTLAPGSNDVGTLTINGNLSLAGNSILDFELGEANVAGGSFNDLVNVGGDLTLDGTIDVTVPSGGAFGPGIYRVFNYGGALTDNGLALGAMPAGSAVSVQTSVLGQVNLVNTAGLTLRFWDGDAGPKNNDLVDGGDGIWRVGGANNNWTDKAGTINADYAQDSFAIFSATPGTVTIDNSGGDVRATGMQFASDGYVITGGPLTLAGAQAIVQVGDNSAVGAGYTATIDAALQGSSQLVKTDAGTLILTGTNSYTGGTAINGGVLQISDNAALGDAAAGLSFDGGTLRTTTDLASNRAIDLIGAGTLLTDSSLDLTGVISGAGGLVKRGAGSLTLTGGNSYTGGTSVNAGTLFVNGDQTAATGLVSIASGATLGGIGTIGGDVTIASGATLSPGDGGGLPGQLTIGGNLSLASGATLSMQFGEAGVAGGALNDLIEVGGDLTLGGATLDVAVSAGGDFGIGIYRVINYGGALVSNDLELGAMPAGSTNFAQTSIAGQVNLVNTGGLALNFWDGDGGAKFNGGIEGGDGVWRAGINDNWASSDGGLNAGYADGAVAIFAGTGGNVTIDNSLGKVTASGLQFAADGYVIGGEALTLTDAQATIRVGDGSAAGAGFTATIAAELTGTARLVKTDAGTLLLSGANSYAGGTAIQGGTLAISADANLGDAAGDVSIGAGTLRTRASLASDRAFALAGDGTILTDQGATFTLNGSLTGAGTLTKDGAGSLLITGDNGGYVADIRVTAGTLAVDGVLGSTVEVMSAGRLEGAGQVGGIGNAGVVAPGRGGIGALTVAGDYAGQGGTLEIEAVLGSDSSASDRLVVNGATSGATRVTVINRDGLGAQTAEGIKIIDVAGASNGTFALNGDYLFQGDQTVVAGAYGYRLYKNGLADPADGDWYLRSSLLDDPGQPNQPQTPLYQPGVPIYEAYGQALLTLTEVGTMQQRIGNRQWAEGENGRPSGIWGRMQASRSRPNAVASTSLADVNVDDWKLEIGADHVLRERADGSRLVLGIVGGYGEASASIGSIYGTGSIKAKGYSASATLTWFGAKGFYVDGRAQLTWFDSELRSTLLGTLTDGNDGTGQAYSLEVGKRAPIGRTLSITPQLQMIYQTVKFDGFTDPNGALVTSQLGDSLKTRWGLSLDRQNAASHIYGVANLSYEWLDGTVTNVSGTPIARQNNRLWGELGIGGSVRVGDRLTLYAEASANTALRDFADSYSLKGNAGVRLAF